MLRVCFQSPHVFHVGSNVLDLDVLIASCPLDPFTVRGTILAIEVGESCFEVWRVALKSSGQEGRSDARCEWIFIPVSTSKYFSLAELTSFTNLSILIS